MRATDNRPRVMITGASGFVGRALYPVLTQAGFAVRTAVRRSAVCTAPADTAVVGDIGRATDWSAALRDVEIVVHLAARVHVLTETPGHEAAYAETNARGTENLAAAAARCGVRRFVYLSTVKVNGEATAGQPFRASDEARPMDAYARSKWAAECALHAAAAGNMQAVVVRAPLVYGCGVRANFLRLMDWIDQGRPLPLGAVRNARSLVSVWNLCDLLLTLTTHPLGAGTWLVCDGEDLSTPELIRRLARAMGRRARLLAVPPAALRLYGALARKQEEVARLCSSLVVDGAATCATLGWRPPWSVDESLDRTAAWYRSGALS